MGTRPRESAAEFLPADRADLHQLRAASQECRGCPLYERATQTVFGMGPDRARRMLIGEQPGDQEEVRGLPFVGPAGRLLTETLSEIGIHRDEVYLTNAVKHFKWEARGSRRLHKKPSAREVEACKPWILAEIAAVRPDAVVCLGATATQALLGRDARVTELRGRLLDGPDGIRVAVTVHPSSMLRARGEDLRREQRARFRDDLQTALALD